MVRRDVSGDQDFWRLAGIFRSVFLRPTPMVHLRDFFARAELDDDYAGGILRVTAKVRNTPRARRRATRCSSICSTARGGSPVERSR